MFGAALAAIFAAPLAQSAILGVRLFMCRVALEVNFA